MNEELRLVVEKVRKLYALAASTNENEASSAIAAAELLIQRYRLTQVELETSTLIDTEIPVEFEESLERGGAVKMWKKILLSTMVEHYGCASWSTTSWRSGRRQTVYRIVGNPTDTILLKVQYDKVKEQIDKLTITKGGNRSQKDAYRKGLVVAVRNRLKEAREQSRASCSSTAIVKLDERCTDSTNVMNLLHPNLRMAGKLSLNVRSDAYYDGLTDGKKIHLGEELPASTSSCNLLLEV